MTRIEQLELRNQELCIKVQNIAKKATNGDLSTLSAGDHGDLIAAHTEHTENLATLKTLKATQAAVNAMQAAGDQVQAPVSGTLNPGAPLSFRQEPYRWTSSSGRTRNYSPSEDSSERHYSTPDYTRVFNQYLRKPRAYREGQGHLLQQRAESMNVHPQVMNVLRQDDDFRGGLFTLPEELMTGVLKTLDDEVHTLGLSKQITISTSDTVGIRTRTDKATFVGPRSELGNYLKTIESGLKWGKRTMQTHEFAMAMLMSEQLLEHTNTDLWSLYLAEVQLSGAEWMEQKLLYGTGIGEPMGLFTVGTTGDGIGTDRDITVAAGELGASPPTGWQIYNKFGYNTLLRMFWNLKPGHQSKAVWMFNSNQMMNLALLTDPSGQYIWKPSLLTGITGSTSQSSLLGRPLYHNLWAPGAETPESYFGLFANMEYYWTIWHRRMRMRTYNEIMALQGLIVTLLDFQFDAQPVLPEAFCRGKYAAD